MQLIYTVILLLALQGLSSSGLTEPEENVCDSEIYCQGKLLDTVQRSRIFDDSKTFVDMPLKHNPDEVTSNFQSLYDKYSGNIPKDELINFVNDNFFEAGNELVTVDPVDWKESPKIIEKVKDPTLKKFIRALNHIWKELTRITRNTTEELRQRSSLLPLPEPFVIPGGRFREYYYWDTYWVVRGVLMCEMPTTARGMIVNFLSLVKQLGFIPNGGRVYYTKRSQPPFLIPMSYEYYKHTDDSQFILENLPTLEQEYNHWFNNRVLDVAIDDSRSAQYFQYRADSNVLRPEGYVPDIEVLEKVPEDQHQRTLRDIAAACESGWDFSSRWFAEGTLPTIQTTNIVPVDLNALMCGNERILSVYFQMSGDQTKSKLYHDRFIQRKTAIKDLLWNEEAGFWFDYLLAQKKHNMDFYMSNALPLFTGCYDEEDVPKVLQYLKNSGLLNFPGGIPVSLQKNTGQQWDFPNAWPPSMHMLIEGLGSTKNEDAQKMARDMAEMWVRNNWKTWKDLGHMYEKLDVQTYGTPGGAGEYSNQKGFGWANGVMFILLNKYGDTITASPMTYAGPHHVVLIVVISLAIVLLIVATCAIVALWQKNKNKKKSKEEKIYKAVPQNPAQQIV